MKTLTKNPTEAKSDMIRALISANELQDLAQKGDTPAKLQARAYRELTIKQVKARFEKLTSSQVEAAIVPSASQKEKSVVSVVEPKKVRNISIKPVKADDSSKSKTVSKSAHHYTQAANPEMFKPITVKKVTYKKKWIYELLQREEFSAVSEGTRILDLAHNYSLSYNLDTNKFRASKGSKILRETTASCPKIVECFVKAYKQESLTQGKQAKKK